MPERFEQAVTRLLGAVGSSSGRDYLERFIAAMASLCEADFAFVARLDPDDRNHLELLAVYDEHGADIPLSWPLRDSVAEAIIAQPTACIFRTRVAEKFPADTLIRRSGAYSLAGVPLLSPEAERSGLIALTSRTSIEDDLFTVEMLQLFAGSLTAGIEQIEAQPVSRPDGGDHSCRRELETVRRELEDLSHTVSHDLRGPLRAIDGFSEILVTDYADRLDAEATDYVTRIRRNARQMDERLQALLGLSRATRHPLCRSPMDLSETCAGLVEQLRRADPQRGTAVSIQPGLRASCDPGLVTIALEQLLDNAWKYTRDNAAPQIVFSADDREEERVYCVSDNGIGFDMLHTGKLFELFERLHGREANPGAGGGLTIARRIIERHGGKIWAQAQPGAGASFYFTLPAPSDDRAPVNAPL